MKRLSIFKIMAVLVTLAFIFAMCTKETSNVRLNPTLSTTQYSKITWDSATVVGYVVAAGSGFSERGICYGTVSGPTTASSKVVYSANDKLATFTIRLGGLARLTKYYAKAYAINSNETIYGEELSFSTTAAMPAIADITTSAIAITRDSGVTATTAINITDDGGPDKTANITSRGVVFGLYSHPTTDSSKTIEGTGKVAFNSLALNLKGNKKYYLRAYATNKIGTTYSNEINFTTPISYGNVKTNDPTLITKTTATFHGLVSYNGGGTISEKGFCYSLNANPTIASTKVAVSTTKDSINADITGLTNNTSYHLRAFVTNEAGTNYGADVSFKTLADILTWYLPGDYVAASYPGSSFADWSPGSSPIIMSTIAAGDMLEGYVNMANGTNNWKFATQPNWNGPNYANNDASGTLEPGILDPNAKNNITSSTGYYKINANATAMTYTAVATTWGIIGDATAGGWPTQTDMTYYPSTGVFGIYANLVSTGHFKFRGTSDWNVAYGSASGDGVTLDVLPNNNINVPATANYAITLNLSVPNTYTYRIDSVWSVIGNATPGGWSNDSPMTWDAVNKVFTVTVALVSASGSNQFKFRANHAWDANFGGNGTSDGSADNYTNATTAPLSSGGHNLGVPGNVDGTYTITLDPWAHIATVTKNKKK